MTDASRLRQRLQGAHACIRIVTHEEDYALGLVRDHALAASRHLWLWSAIGGAREGLLAGSTPIKDTEDPVKGLNWLRGCGKSPLCVALDLAEHLDAARPLRAARDLIAACRTSGARLILLDHSDDWLLRAG